MRVGLDAHMVGGQETGNETYVRGLVEGLKEIPDGPDVIVYHQGTAWTSSSSHVRFTRLAGANPYSRLGLELPLRSLGQRLDVLHMSYAAPIWSAAPIVLTVHDICYATNPEWFSARDLRVLNSNVPRSIRAASHVITDSRTAREQIIKTYAVPPDKITSISIGAGPAAEPIADDEAAAELRRLQLRADRQFVLAVGNLQPRKNLVRLVQAFDHLVRGRGLDLDLVIVGPKRFRAEEAMEAARALPERVHFTGYVTDRQLAACYQSCLVFAFPSLYEGFGLPAIEAMSHGAPCVCSNAGSLPEVCADAAIYFDPLSVEEMSQAVERAVTDDQLRKRLGRAGIERARGFDWGTTARHTVEVYQRVVS